jgi:hypothetical protein
MDDYISRRTAINRLWKALYDYEGKTEKQFQESDELDIEDWFEHRIFVQNMNDIDRQTILEMPSADVVIKTDLLGWLLAYHMKSFELKGRYMPHEVIGWLINDLTKNFMGERGEQNG